MKILIIEDDAEIARQISDFLENAGFICKIAADGDEGLYEGESDAYDAILLDVGLPGMDGFKLLASLRKSGITTPVLILTSRTGKMETIHGLELGADDYIYKPFDIDEVIARVRTHIRKSKNIHSAVLSYKNVSLDTRSGRVVVDKRIVRLTRIEYLILQYLFMNQGKTVSITEVTDHVYTDFDNDSSIIPRHIANIRKKIGAEIITTDSNRGYCVPAA